MCFNKAGEEGCSRGVKSRERGGDWGGWERRNEEMQFAPLPGVCSGSQELVGPCSLLRLPTPHSPPTPSPRPF
ncbi:hypothetical protein PAL_GLEAN10017391 [Pteropus alecto]|uniref:Uncharacterized protein n=1 Tax=Pteropus alecto TaxID=9402 RepID=L5K611_PTEAL|nr:hypothetical protein PAL_GLEAN10017391 [Pteropus alecto]